MIDLYTERWLIDHALEAPSSALNWKERKAFWNQVRRAALVFGFNLGNRIDCYASPWAFLGEVNRYLEEGATLHSVVSRRCILDLTQYYHGRGDRISPLPPSSGLLRTVHIINDGPLIRKVLLDKNWGRNGPISTPYPIMTDLILEEGSNMMRPFHPSQGPEEHKRLRCPYRHLASKAGLESACPDLLPQLAFSLAREKGSLIPLISHITAIGDKLTSVERASTLKTLFIASHVTTELTFAFAVRALDDVWIRRCQERWEKRFGMLDIDIETLSTLPQTHPIFTQLARFVEGEEACSDLKAFVQEVLRVYPVVPALARVILQKTQIEETELKRGDVVLLNIQGANLAKGREFNPDRYLTEQGPDEEPLFEEDRALLTFSAGRESCLGERLAKWGLALKVMMYILKKRLDAVGHTESKAPVDYQLAPPFSIPSDMDPGETFVTFLAQIEAIWNKEYEERVQVYAEIDQALRKEAQATEELRALIEKRIQASGPSTEIIREGEGLIDRQQVLIEQLKQNNIRKNEFEAWKAIFAI